MLIYSSFLHYVLPRILREALTPVSMHTVYTLSGGVFKIVVNSQTTRLCECEASQSPVRRFTEDVKGDGLRL